MEVRLKGCSWGLSVEFRTPAAAAAVEVGAGEEKGVSNMVFDWTEEVVMGDKDVDVDVDD